MEKIVISLTAKFSRNSSDYLFWGYYNNTITIIEIYTINMLG
jgi:hypothetical protein